MEEKKASPAKTVLTIRANEMQSIAECYSVFNSTLIIYLFLVVLGYVEDTMQKVVVVGGERDSGCIVSFYRSRGGVIG